MKVRIEKIKSIILALLVLLSLALTWGLWTFQPQYDFRQKVNNLNSVAIGEKRQFNEVIKPTQFIYHQDGLHYGVTDSMFTDEIYQMVMDLNSLEYEHITFSTPEQLDSILLKERSLEMIFPVNLPINISNYIMGPIRQEWDINYFDRIIVSFSKEPALYLISYATDQAVKLKVEQNEAGKINELLLHSNFKNSPYFTVSGNQGHTLYLPEQRIAIKQLTFSTQNILSSDFKNALFNDPNTLKQYRLNNGEESFTDGTRALEISQNQDMMRFVNPANQEVYELEPEEMILKSIEFINDHSGWTDSFSLIDWSRAKHTVKFQLMVNGHLVFNDKGATMIYESWRDNEIYEYVRSLTNLRFAIDSEQKQVILPSGRELLSYLTQVKPDFTLSSLEAALVGYDFSKEKLNTAVATVKPKWYIKYDGKWEGIYISSTSISQGGEKLGLE
ncbi:two-component system activity regulator YycH [Schinkia azotoformans]|uniref:Regulatory protein YycH domain-containing protein n=1 Tax=Schinkia azotoformans LMG 9581 TaxID=1131731 RepID=K6D840_SCHAZ|nr:two-component system activity regulator YycH [Schinkia azotoformans]EKN68692.1 hypothetical protein BAZO_02901 [Schinkia azotoformans LMG 9581]MEC1639017.1 two-component system activity regulator YycH [Schinkia azotoformans]MEC1722025.1 two-component system activity regulator YycH [Schinkia azotoformans]MEC1945225.1 two-component system activity regulator YycH [Schinkia azotoformans]MED4353976.1 two-component system activity regulator YycH [Schinkia azotoformans]